MDLNSGNSNSVTMTAQWDLVNYVKTFSYTGSAQTWTVPVTGRYKIELWGAQGGTDNTTSQGVAETSSSRIRAGGYGGYVSGEITLKANEPMYVYVGQQPPHTGYKDVGGWNGGGSVLQSSGNTGDYDKTGGGGATDIRTVSGSWNAADSLRSRIMVAGAGGGGLYESDPWQGIGGNAGGLTAYSPTSVGSNSSSYTATGGNQTAGGSRGSAYSGSTGTNGSFGIGGDGTHRDSSCGGGAGWYGGGAPSFAAAAAGGSSYISGHTGSVGVTSTSSSSPKSGCSTGTTSNACSLTPYINPATSTSYTFTNTLIIDGAGYKWTNAKGSLQAMPNPAGGNYGSGVGHTGNGYAKITYLGN